MPSRHNAEGVHRGGNKECAGLGDRFTQELDQRLWMLSLLMPEDVEEV